MQTLMPHQVTGCEAVVRALEVPPDATEHAVRAQVRMACGTGKTRLAAEVANRVAGGGRVLVVEPTLQLVRQNLLAFRRDGGRRGAMAVVCSMSPSDSVLVAHEAPSTTSPAQLAWWWSRLERQGHRTWTVFTTYASIPTVVAAHALRVPGIPPLPAWDLIITDEAHRSAGTTTWAQVNDQSAVPARRRLALTATPRVWSTFPRLRDLDAGATPGLVAFPAPADVAPPPSPRPPSPALGVRVPVAGVEQPLASMDNPVSFGPVAYELSLQEAQAQGLVARFQIVVAEIDDPVLQQAVAEEGRSGVRVRGLYLAAQQAALLKAARTYGLRRVLAYANRVEDAEAFADTLAAQAGRLRRAGVRVPRRVWSAALSAQHTAEERHAVLGRELAEGRDLRGRPLDLSVVASVRVLREGVDVPAVDAVAFVDPRAGAIDLVQCVGRALRVPVEQRPDRAGEFGAGPAEKVATIVVPVVHLEPGSRDDLYGPAWDPLLALLRALRAHSETLVDRLSTPRTPHRPPMAEHGEDREAREAPEAEASEAEAPGPAAEEPGGVLRFLLGERDPGEIARWVRLRVRESLADDSARALAAAERYRERTGHLRVPRAHREGDVLLGVQLESWRKAHRAGELDRGIAARLDRLGIVWSPRADGWQAMWRAVRAYGEREGHLLPRRDEIVEVDGREHAIGRIMTDCRRPAFARRWPERVRDLDALGIPWRVSGPWHAGWQRRLTLLDRFLDDGGDLAELLAGSRLFGGEDLGRWVSGQLARWTFLAPEQQSELLRRGIGARAGAGPAPTVGTRKPSRTAARRRSRAERFELLVTAARRHLDEVGPLVDAHGRHIVAPAWTTVVDDVDIHLRQRLHTARQRRSGLTDEQLGLLAELGLPWADEERDRRRGTAAP
ncbi:Helicase associated domain protein [Streptomyces sp. NPDC002851]